MKSIKIILTIWLFSISLLNANPVSQENAQKTAISWYTHIASSTVMDYSVEDIFTVTEDNHVTMYVFNFKSGGFVIVAADDASIPILGYSVENPFPSDISCPAVNEWLEDYSLQINQIVKEGLGNQKTKGKWEAIQTGNFPVPTKDVEPLLTTTWDQGCYYNELCPIDPAGPCGHARTGCIATAMAQIMKYHNFPLQGVGSYSYTHPYYGVLPADFGNTTYDWASMPDNVTSSNIPVATIMYHAGVAVNMYYGANESGANLENVQESFMDYFNYEPVIQWHDQFDYPDPEDWKVLIRTDLDNQLPICYRGRNLSEGHVFVCDGYNLASDVFHFNWGWGGPYNGWFAIGALNPANDTYNLHNIILANIRPYNPELITRITHPVDNFVANVGTPVEIEAATVFGNADYIKITIDDISVATSASNTISYTWNTVNGDLGSHDIISWSYSGNDSVCYPINLNVTDDWVKQASGFQIKKSINYLSAIDSNVVWAIAGDGVDNFKAPCQAFSRTVDGGETWITGNVPNCGELTLAMIQGVNSQKAYVAMYRISGSDSQGIYVTSDGGNTWEHQATAAFNDVSSFINCVHFFNENDGWCMGDPISVGGGFEMYTTSNGGTNWIPVPVASMPPSIPTEYGVIGNFSTINDTVWFGTNYGRVYKSVDKGYNWTVTSLNGMAGKFIKPVFRNGSHGLVFVESGELGLYETFDGGESWEVVNFSGPLYQTSLAFVPGTDNTWISTGGLWGNYHKGASYSKDGGHTWTAFPGTQGANFHNMAWINPNCGWAGSFNQSATEGGIFKFVGDLLISSTSFNNYSTPKTLSVFPNPFTANTTIEFNLPNPDFVTLSTYDITGKHLKTILSKKLSKGNHKINWNAESLNEGIYFIRLETNTSSVVQKIVILK